MEIKVEHRKGDQSAEALRANGMLPGILYGGGRASSTSIAVNYGAFMKLRKGSTTSTVIDVDLGDEVVKALVTNIQLHPVTDEMLHVDLRQVDMTQPVKAHVPIRFVGDSPAVKAGGMLIRNRDRVLVKSLPGVLPEAIEVDVSLLTEFEQGVRVGDLSVVEGVEILEDGRISVVVVRPPRKISEFDTVEGEVAALPEAAGAGEAAREDGAKDA